MANPADALTIQFLEWVASGPRSYAEVMEAWRTSCPRLTIWEDAMLGGVVRYEGGDRKTIALTPEGRAVIEGRRGLADAAE
ncbi:MAG: hypothetical protein EXQ92_03085 [Alphaproteobacteria bacterium]|nr:hypothetical protein [Alphaproteobacteria bacterium]